MNASYIQLAQQQITLPNPTGRCALGWDLNQTHPPHGMQEWTASEGRHSSWCLGEQAIYWWAGHKTGGAMLPSDPTSGAETKVTHCLGWRHTNYVHFIFFSLGIQFRLLHCPVSLAFRWEPCTWFLSNGMWMVARWPHPSMTKKKKSIVPPTPFTKDCGNSIFFGASTGCRVGGVVFNQHALTWRQHGITFTTWSYWNVWVVHHGARALTHADYYCLHLKACIRIYLE